MRSIRQLTPLALLFLFTLCAIPACRAASDCSVHSDASPCIDKIDPPEWWVAMPSPMLLLHGRNLAGAHAAITGLPVAIEKTQASANGHWLFMWLQTGNAPAGTLNLSLTSRAGSTTADYRLAPRKPADAGFHGVSAADSIYLIMTDRFADGDPSNDDDAAQRARPRGWHGGDLRGITRHLDYLQSLGVTTVWTTPVYRNIPSPQSYHGYSATDMYSVDPHYGTLADYQHLAAALHARGMKIVLDTVPNHVGPANPWVTDPPLPDWFHGTLAHHSIAKTEFRSIPDPHASPAERRDITQGWFADVLPDLNQENPVVAQYLIQNAVWWIETAGLDGLRIDTFPYVNRAFWQQFHATLHALYPDLTTVGEIFNPDPTITSYFAGGVTHDGIDTGLYTPFDFPTYFTLRSVLIRNEPMTKLENIFRQDELYPHPERLVTFLGNHDTARFLSEPGATPAELQMAFGLITTLRGTPQIYSGDEIAMEGGDDPDNRRDFPGGFASDAQPSAFTAATRTAPQRAMFDWASSLLRLRHEHPALQGGQQQDVLDGDATAFAYVRAADVSHGCAATSSNQAGDRLLMVLNNGTTPRTVSIRIDSTALAGCATAAHLLGPGSDATIEAGTLSVMLPAKSFAIYAPR